jgi:hypothetical protein
MMSDATTMVFTDLESVDPHLTARGEAGLRRLQTHAPRPRAIT